MKESILVCRDFINKTWEGFFYFDLVITLVILGNYKWPIKYFPHKKNDVMDLI